MTMVVHVAVQGFLFGLAAMNAFWYPSPVTVGLLPAFAAMTFLVVRWAKEAGQ